ncbi:MAG: hypothetical protein ACOYD4_06770 [Solirubrobacterales bacterium]
MDAIRLERKPKPNDWTAEQIDTLRALAGQVPVAEIAAIIGRPVRATCTKAYSLGIRIGTKQMRRPWTADEIKALRALAGTCSREQAAAQLGRTVSSVCAMAGSRGISFATRDGLHYNAKYPTETIHQVIRLSTQGKTSFEVADATGIPASYVRQITTYSVRYRETTNMAAD